jgi:hypothetical protein
VKSPCRRANARRGAIRTVAFTAGSRKSMP